MSQFGGETLKNPPWSNGQSTGVLVSQQNQLQPQLMAQLSNTGAVTMFQYPQAQTYQPSQMGQLQQPGMTLQTIGAIGSNQITIAGGLPTSMQSTTNSIQQQQQQVYPQMSVVSYPTRGMIATPFLGNSVPQAVTMPSSDPPKHRVFTGTITKVQDNIGFVDGEVFFQSSCCEGGNPQLGDQVFVEAMYNPNMPFKWNVTKMKVLPPENVLKPLPPGTGRGRRFSSIASSSFTDTPDPVNKLTDVDEFAQRNTGANKRNRRNNNFNRKRRKQEIKNNERFRDEKEITSNEKEEERSKSPPPAPRKISKPARSRKAVVVTRGIGQIDLDMPEADVLELKKRYGNLYIPSDFFVSSFKWVEVFPPNKALTLENPCEFHILHKDVDPVIKNDAVLDPPDADYRFSAKVMLLSMPTLDEIYKKCCALAEDREENHDDKDLQHPSCLVSFLVGLRGKNETMAIGGPWSPSLDGANPDKDPSVLIKTAIRTCKALTGIDLTPCSQWYRFLEIYYHRSETVHKGSPVLAQVETVVLYLPDVWRCLPTRLEWDGLHLNYKRTLDQLLAQRETDVGDKGSTPSEVSKKEPTHYSQLDPRNMKINELREELEARNLPSKGLTSQLMARLIKVLKTEQEKEDLENASKSESEKTRAVVEKAKEEERKRKEEEEKTKQTERDLQLMHKRYTLPDKGQILVHPSRTAKSGKFNCSVMPLSSLLDYRQEDTKEHSFEVFLFVELFNEMLMRDFGVCIYKSLVEAQEKPKEEKEDKDNKGKNKKSQKEKPDHEKLEEKNNIDHESTNSEDKKKKELVKYTTINPYLLLAFIYFDHNHHGYLSDKDIEEVLLSIGLKLSRAQIKKLVQKVTSKGSVYYRKLTDRPKEDVITEQKTVSATQALGNKQLLPLFFEEEIPPSKRSRKESSRKKDGKLDVSSGCVMLDGKLLDIGKLLGQIKQSDDSRLKSEKVLDKLRSENALLKSTSQRFSSTIEKLSIELQDFEERLHNATSELRNVDDKTKWYYLLMSQVYETISPVFNRKQTITEEETECNEDSKIEVLKEHS